MVAVAPQDYVAAVMALSWLPTEVFLTNYSKTFGKFESFAHQYV